MYMHLCFFIYHCDLLSDSSCTCMLNSDSSCTCIWFFIYHCDLLSVSMLVQTDPLSFQHHQIKLLKSALGRGVISAWFRTMFCILLSYAIFHPCSLHACHVLFHINVPYKLVQMMLHLMLFHVFLGWNGIEDGGINLRRWHRDPTSFCYRSCRWSAL